MFHLLNNLMFQGTDTNSSSGISKSGMSAELTADDILTVLNSNDSDELVTKEEFSKKEEEVETEVETEDEVEPEEDELTEIEEELKTPTDEDLELNTPVQRRALLKDYPEIFKKHPGLESTIYRERAYTELLPTINDAKEALGAITTLKQFETDLRSGNTVDIMRAVLADDKQAFAKMADNYMENLAQVDERAYHHVLGNITKDIVVAMLKFGKEKEDTEIQDAASSLYQFMFNSTKWEGKKSLSAKDVVNESISAEKQKLDKERQDFEQSKLNEHTTKLMSSIDNQIKGTIEKSIDSKEQMSPFVKTKAIEEVVSKASKLLKMDSRFQQIIQQLTDKSRLDKFSDESLNRIKSAYFTKYKSILIPVIKSVRAEALKGTNSRIKISSDENNDTTERANRASTSRNESGNNNSNSRKPLPGESSLDFLLRK